MPTHPLQNANASWSDAIAGAVQNALPTKQQAHEAYMAEQVRKAAEQLGGLQAKRIKK